MTSIKPTLLPWCIFLGLVSACDAAPEERALEERLIDLGIEDEELLGELTAELTHEQLDAIEVELDDAREGAPDQLGAAIDPAALDLDACSASFGAAGYVTDPNANQTVAAFARLEFGVASSQLRALENLRCQLYCTNVNVCDAEEAYYEYRYLGAHGGLPRGVHFCACGD